ncbi:MAG: Calx-beta domain-containing protein [Kiloniellaceae bacterium]
MKNTPRAFPHAGDATGTTGTLSGFFEELRESFTDSFAYDHFHWPSFESFGAARPSVIDFRTPGERHGEARGMESTGGSEDPVSLYTTTNSDIPVYTIGEVVPVDGSVSPQTNLSGPLIGVDDFRADARFADIDGSGYGIVIIDSGIDLDDPFFGADNNGDGISDRIVYQYDFADNDGNAGDVDGHGSNVASIAASSNGTYTGMAPGADIIALKVFSDSGAGYFSDIEESLQWVINNAAAYNIVSVNMSLGDSGNYNAPIGLYGIADEMSVLASMGVVVVSASGNDFYSYNSVQGVSYPSADPNSLSVGAVYDGNTGGWYYESGAIAYSSGSDRISPFSQRDDALTTVFAPGAPITGAGAGAGLETMHGTSQAAPHITGIIALAQQLAVETLGRKLTFNEISNLLASTGDLIIDGDDENDNVANTGLTFPRVNVVSLGEAILDMAPDPSHFAIAATSAVKAEGDGTTAFIFTVTRSGNTAESATVDYAVGSSQANGADFYGGVLPSGVIGFAAGQSITTLTVWIQGDSDVEADEGFTVTLSNPSGNGEIVTASADGTILNDDVALPPSFAIAAGDAVQAEGDSGSTAFTFTVTRSGDTSAAGSIDYAVSGDADPADFLGGVLPAGTLTFAAGQTSKTLTLQVAGDTVFENDEGFTVTLSNPSGTGEIAIASADGTILNDDVAPPASRFAIAADNAVQAEGDNGSTAFTFTVTRSGDTSVAGSVDYGVSGDAEPDDFLGGVLPAGTLAFAAGETSKTLTLQVAGDTDFENDEGFTVTLANPSPGAAIATPQAAGSIVNDDAPPPAPLVLLQADFDTAGDTGGFTYADGLFGGSTSQRYASGEWNEQALTVTLGGVTTAFGRDMSGGWQTGFTLTETAEVSLSFRYSLNIGNDYEPNEYSQVLVSIDGGTPILVDQLSGDGNGGPDQETGAQSFSAVLGTLAAGSHSLAIGAYNNLKTWILEQADLVIDDVRLTAPAGDTPADPIIFGIAADDAVKAEGDAGTTGFTFTVTRSGDTSVAATVDYAVTGAVNAADFAGGVLPAGTLNFAAGEVVKTLTLDVAGDTDVESDEGFTVSLSNASAGAQIAAGSANGTILNDDTAPTPTILANDADEAVKAGGDDGTTAITITEERSGEN